MTDAALARHDAQTEPPPPDRRIDWPVVGAGIGLFGVLAAVTGQTVDTRQVLLLMVGAGFGLVLYHASFGFTAAWRHMISSGRGRGLRAQMLLLAVTVCLFFPALAERSLFGAPVAGFVLPAGTSVIVGAFIFGIGMQLGGGCGSGTLFTIGGGSTRMVITLVFFCVGSVIGTLHLGWWLELPGFGLYSVVHRWGLWPALAANLAVFGAIALASYWYEIRRRGGIAGDPPAAWAGWRRLWQGPWPVIWGALGLAALSFATLYLAGRPWGITAAFALWGAKTADLAGLPIDQAEYWARRATQLDQSVLFDITSVMNFGIILGAFTASGLAGRFNPSLNIPARQLAAAVIGGLMLGYGARLAFGCNIGAYYSGIASGSLHGWLWLVAGFAGSSCGVLLRPLFGLANEKT